MSVIKDLSLSPNYQVLPFRKSHMESINIPWFEAQYIENLAVDIIGMSLPQDKDNSIQSNDLSYTYIYKGEVLVCFGVNILWRAVGELWIIPSDSDDLIMLSVLSKISQIIDIIIEEYTLNRVQIQVRVANERTLCFINSLGFEKEGLMKQFGPEGGDYFMLSRTINREE